MGEPSQRGLRVVSFVYTALELGEEQGEEMLLRDAGIFGKHV
tara:strand:- start:663 stop:788 length:126 start_codon:yes stop_codon:yes gene_type:complete